jgi:flagellar hook-length control protein FliK
VPIESKVGTPRWTRDIHQSVSMLVQSRTSVAELRLTPADMGPIQIRIDFSEKQPSVSISVQQADTRNALDAALPRLRDMMAESGITLGGAGVEQHGRPSDTPGDQARFAWQGREQAAPLPVAATDQFAPQVRTIALDQLVDTYA